MFFSAQCGEESAQSLHYLQSALIVCIPIKSLGLARMLKVDPDMSYSLNSTKRDTWGLDRGVL